MGKNAGELVLICHSNNWVRFYARHMPRLPDCATIADLLLFVQFTLSLRLSARMDILWFMDKLPGIG